MSDELWPRARNALARHFANIDADEGSDDWLVAFEKHQKFPDADRIATLSLRDLWKIEGMGRKSVWQTAEWLGKLGRKPKEDEWTAATERECNFEVRVARAKQLLARCGYKVIWLDTKKPDA